MFEKDLSISLLYDVYSPLLNGKKREAFEKYYLDDLSLAEIADETGTSRQAVRDMLSRTVDQLREYEKALGLIEKKKKIEKLLSDAEKADGEELGRIYSEIREIL